MVRIVTVKEGAQGVVVVGTDGGSLFRCRPLYLRSAAAAQELSCEFQPGNHCPLGVLELAAAALAAERQALALLARAEQSRSGLRQKLLKRQLDPWAVSVALDLLQSQGLLDDVRFASAWIRQRVRRHAEGPLSLAAALLRRGVDNACCRKALAEAFSGNLRRQALQYAAEKLSARYPDASALRFRLKALGYRSEEIQTAVALSGLET